MAEVSVEAFQGLRIRFDSYYGRCAMPEVEEGCLSTAGSNVKCGPVCFDWKIAGVPLVKLGFEIALPRLDESQTLIVG